MKRLLPIILLAGCTTAPAPAARQIHATCETPALPPAPVRGPGVLPVPGPQTEPATEPATTAPGKSNASANNGRGGNYSRTCHADNGKGRGKGKK